MLELACTNALSLDVKGKFGTGVNSAMWFIGVLFVGVKIGVEVMILVKDDVMILVNFGCELGDLCFSTSDTSQKALVSKDELYI